MSDYRLTWCDICDVPVVVGFEEEHKQTPGHVKMRQDYDRVQAAITRKKKAAQ